ncbi:hydroxyethylthiazole kinase (plasmid) [Legionella adelaidensis]|uniref:Hydroxyethylthiazole kinase n=1 Tax=Legionella adelaidensis TaxID=45056 RepID=A0A0W0R108_9GAMM|nr:hydroxyethylthiazole kinase [Legionella adelaidensis]KTC64717.1 hydroxyethylthiazole kinase [Legionella adelaidensis]VEH82847.1 hydroxyethylthiazole kinase [Legionella adelaidensis]
MDCQTTELLSQIKNNKPLVLNITNHVTMDFVANGLIALGASPIMSLAAQEINELMQIANAAVINIGTLNDAFIPLCEKACEAANQLGKPLVLDPVGAGASYYRTKTCLDLLERFAFSVIRGNASEIMALAGVGGNTKGVDSSFATQQAVQSAKLLATRYNSVVIISGQIDTVVSVSTMKQFEFGSSLMPMLTGSGCLLSAVVGAFAAVHADWYAAASSAVVFYGICGERAAKQAEGPGSFKPHFLDALALIPGRDCYARN